MTYFTTPLKIGFTVLVSIYPGVNKGCHSGVKKKWNNSTSIESKVGRSGVKLSHVCVFLEDLHMSVGVMKDLNLKLRDVTSLINWVPWGTGTPKDRDEVSRR
jgi:hypothetical protein